MQMVIRATVMFLFLWLVMRVMGRKELAEMSAFDLVLLIVMGDLIQQGVTQQDNSITGAVTAVSTFVLWILAMSYTSFKNKKARNVLEGQPVIVVREGKPLPKMLRYERLTLDEVKDAAREQGIGDLRQVSIGVLETDGSFSFVRYDDERRPPKKELEV